MHEIPWISYMHCMDLSAPLDNMDDLCGGSNGYNEIQWMIMDLSVPDRSSVHFRSFAAFNRLKHQTCDPCDHFK